MPARLFTTSRPADRAMGRSFAKIRRSLPSRRLSFEPLELRALLAGPTAVASVGTTFSPPEMLEFGGATTILTIAADLNGDQNLDLVAVKRRWYHARLLLYTIMDGQVPPIGERK